MGLGHLQVSQHHEPSRPPGICLTKRTVVQLSMLQTLRYGEAFPCQGGVLMREISIKEVQVQYGLTVDESVLGQEPLLLRRHGELVAAIVPIAEYEAFLAWREAEERRKRRQAIQEAFERERVAYAQLEESLRPQYEGLYVAIRGGQVVDSDADELTLITRVYERFGYGPMYVRKVGAPLPVVRIPSPRVVSP